MLETTIMVVVKLNRYKVTKASELSSLLYLILFHYCTSRGGTV
jgi:hypothetical protein